MLIAAFVIIAKTANCLISTYRRMHINCSLYNVNGILLKNKKEMNHWYTHYGWISKKLSQTQKIYSEWFHLYEVLEQTELISGNRNWISGCFGREWGAELTGKEHKESFGVAEMLSEWVIQVSAFVNTDETVPLRVELYVHYPLTLKN